MWLITSKYYRGKRNSSNIVRKHDLPHIITNVEDMYRVADDPMVQDSLLKFGDGAPRFLKNRAQQMIMLGPILLTMGKKHFTRIHRLDDS